VVKCGQIYLTAKQTIRWRRLSLKLVDDMSGDKDGWWRWLFFPTCHRRLSKFTNPNHWQYKYKQQEFWCGRELARCAQASADIGAVVEFIGQVRDINEAECSFPRYIRALILAWRSAAPWADWRRKQNRGGTYKRKFWLFHRVGTLQTVRFKLYWCSSQCAQKRRR